jgi:hypothetical protein
MRRPLFPHRSVLPTVGVSPNVVPHGGRNFCCHVVRRQMYILENFDSTIYFSKIMTK